MMLGWLRLLFGKPCCCAAMRGRCPLSAWLTAAACVSDGWRCGCVGALGESQLRLWLALTMMGPVGIVPRLGGVVLPPSKMLVPPGKSSSSWFLPEWATVVSSSLPPWRHRLWRSCSSMRSFSCAELSCRRMFTTNDPGGVQSRGWCGSRNSGFGC